MYIDVLGQKHIHKQLLTDYINTYQLSEHMHECKCMCRRIQWQIKCSSSYAKETMKMAIFTNCKSITSICAMYRLPAYILYIHIFIHYNRFYGCPWTKCHQKIQFKYLSGRMRLFDYWVGVILSTWHFLIHVLFLLGHLSYIAWIVYHLIADKYQPPNFPAQKNDS